MHIFTADGSEWELDPAYEAQLRQDAVEAKAEINDDEDLIGYMRDVVDDDEILRGLRLVEVSSDLWRLLLPTGYHWTSDKADLDDMPIFRSGEDD